MKLILSSPDLVLERLRDDIVTGRLAPGVALRQDDLARSFGVSHIPVREALCRLRAEGLVEIRPRRGAIVADLSADEIRELNEMRVALECCALRLAIPRISAGQLRRAAKILDRIDREPQRWGALNTEFHSTLYAPAQRPRLLATILSLQRNVERYLHREAELTNNLDASQREHRRLLELIEARQVDAACALLTDHIVVPGKVLEQYLRSASPDGRLPAGRTA
jgi:DNA-binding GntR family transcriptional regulator